MSTGPWPAVPASTNPVRPSRANRPTRGDRTAPADRPAPGAAVAGQLLALCLVAVLTLPLLPVLALIIAWIRGRDRLFGQGRSTAVPPAHGVPLLIG